MSSTVEYTVDLHVATQKTLPFYPLSNMLGRPFHPLFSIFRRRQQPNFC